MVYIQCFQTKQDYDNNIAILGNNGSLVSSITGSDNNVYVYAGKEDWGEYKWYNEANNKTVYTDFRNPTNADVYRRSDNVYKQNITSTSTTTVNGESHEDRLDLIIETGKIGYKIDLSNGHDYVDLGLPSGVLWATCNVGGKYPWSDGNVYAFGETEVKENYTKETYKYWDGTDNFSWVSKYDGSGTLDLYEDAARINMGGKWRTPTSTEINELFNNTTKEITTLEGNSVMKFTSTINGNELYFPWQCIRQDGTSKIRYALILTCATAANWYNANQFFVISTTDCSVRAFYSQAMGLPVRAVMNNRL